MYLNNSCIVMLKLAKKGKLDKSALSKRHASSYNENLDYLIREKLLVRNIVSFRSSRSGYKIPAYSFTLSPAGASFLDDRFRSILWHVIPYSITTLISIVSLLNSVFDFI